ncbi:hypothetical protein [Acidaminobacter hydrogenoformans]|uniref:Uncharacterized protein n=1 Tax=Acidaminobacter hydrogenoformans DSM 2784 TaxID=1120920 RepID=A0A1G5S3W6_9FIRM|nr:hypothetical protein [Acidaminobacter hydrogenoformans]SCZ81013.1 hypothetical protein SAMN03080599_02563 [Acidaminobacter hydrogenoformans DSM 2784]
MEKKIQKLYSTDCVTMMLFLAIFWLLLIYIAFNVIAIVSDPAVKGVIIVAAALIAAFGTASSIAVLVHLRKNQRQIYVEELLSYEHEREA